MTSGMAPSVTDAGKITAMKILEMGENFPVSLLEEEATHIMGIDPDTKGIGWHVIDAHSWNLINNGYIEREHKKRGVDEDYNPALEQLIHEASALRAWIFLEDIFCKNRQGFKRLAQVQGEILLYARDALFSYELEDNRRPKLFTVLANQWQSEVFSSYSITEGTTKEKALEATTYFAGDAPLHNEHMVDACCIARYGAGKWKHLQARIQDVGREKAYKEVSLETPFG